MANKSNIKGLIPIGGIYAAGYTGKVRAYVVPATDAVALFLGDAVKLVGNTAKNETGEDLQAVTKVTAGADIPVGAVVGVKPSSDNVNQVYRSASDLRTVFVCDDPYALFTIQADDVIAAENIGLNADLSFSSGDTIWGNSGMQLDVATLSSDSKQLRIIDVVPSEDNELGLYTKLIVMFNKHVYKQATGI